jgi:amino acid adenylation domain-containing protein
MRLSDLLARSAEAFPDRPAVQGQHATWTYRQLDEFSDAIAGSLLAIDGLQKERVGVYMDKAPETVAALFGILKSGACYVPLDPGAPPERLKLIIADCGLNVLVTSVHKRNVLPPLLSPGTPLQLLLFVDGEPGEDSRAWPVDVRALSPEGERPAQRPRTADDDDSALAYILYTSGSTGQPKGVMISHRAAWAFVEWSADLLRLSEMDRFASIAPFHFDLSVFDLYTAVLHGGCICLVPSGVAIFPRSLADYIEKQGITVWYSVPSVLIQLALHGGFEQRNLSRLRYVIFAGEVFPTKYLSKLLAQVPTAEHFNWYGPTETNVCTYYQVREAPPEDATIPIGAACSGQCLYVVDETGRLCAEGEIGELWVHGPTLMEGYWNDPEKTAGTLLRDPFCDGERKVYRTGDLVRTLEGGDLEYHGRLDHMIKSRGYRIEIGEIETVLLRHEEIREAAVVGIPDELIGRRIKAVVCPKSGGSLTAAAIKEYCRNHLPSYMVPDAVELVEMLPRTSTNKINRKLLEKEPPYGS